VGVVERSLHERGNSLRHRRYARSLYQFLHAQFPEIPAGEARAGDVLFFDMGEGSGCGGHTGLVDLVDSGGPTGVPRMARRQRAPAATSILASRTPRRAGALILNTFLRVKLPNDPPSTRYFAGELLCSVVRPQL